MPRFSTDLKLTKGYSRFLEGASINLSLDEGPFHLDTTVLPLRLLRERGSLELVFSAKQTLKGSNKTGLRWRIDPRGQIRAVLLGPGTAFLGNFRVPEKHFAVQWRVDASITSAIRRRSLMEVKAGSTCSQFWVQVFAREELLLGALRSAWESYLDPFDPVEAGKLINGQVELWKWRGSCNLSLDIGWNAVRGWQLSSSAGPVDFGWSSRLQVGMKAGLRVSHSGTYSLRLSRWRGRFSVSLSTSKDTTWEAGFKVKASAREGFRLRSEFAWIDPLVDPLENTLTKALNRKAEIALAVETARSHGRKQLLKIEWKKRYEDSFSQVYRGFLEGRMPTADSRIRFSGRLEVLTRQILSIQFNLFKWVQVGASTERREYSRANVTATGDVSVEVGVSRQETRYRNNELDLLRFLFLQRTASGGRTAYEWSFEHSGRFSYRSLHNVLRAALHVRAIPRFDLPGCLTANPRLELVWVSRMSAKGLERIRGASNDETWRALVRALELTEPERYGADSVWRDWIDSEDVREVVDQNPVHASLRARYPLPGRTDFERRQVVANYRQAKRLIQVIEGWRKHDQEGITGMLQAGLGFPLFLMLDLLCPRSEKQSVLMIRGDLERVWGNLELLDQPDDKPARQPEKR